MNEYLLKIRTNDDSTDVSVYPSANNGIPRNTWQDGWNEGFL